MQHLSCWIKKKLNNKLFIIFEFEKKKEMMIEIQILLVPYYWVLWSFLIFFQEYSISGDSFFNSNFHFNFSTKWFPLELSSKPHNYFLHVLNWFSISILFSLLLEYQFFINNHLILPHLIFLHLQEHFLISQLFLHSIQRAINIPLI